MPKTNKTLPEWATVDAEVLLRSSFGDLAECKITRVSKTSAWIGERRFVTPTWGDKDHLEEYGYSATYRGIPSIRPTASAEAKMLRGRQEAREHVRALKLAMEEAMKAFASAGGRYYTTEPEREHNALRRLAAAIDEYENFLGNFIEKS